MHSRRFSATMTAEDCTWIGLNAFYLNGGPVCCSCNEFIAKLVTVYNTVYNYARLTREDFHSTEDEMSELAITLSSNSDNVTLTDGYLDSCLGGSHDACREIGVPRSLVNKNASCSSGDTQDASRVEHDFNSDFIEVT